MIATCQPSEPSSFVAPAVPIGTPPGNASCSSTACNRGDLKRGEQLSFVVPPGMHTVVARIDKWWGSPELLLDVAPGQVHTLNVAPGGSAWTAIFQLFTPHSYLKLSPESAHFGSG